MTRDITGPSWRELYDVGPGISVNTWLPGDSEEDQQRRECAAVTSQAFANCVYPPNPSKPRYQRPPWREFMPPWEQRLKRRYELPPNRLIRVAWPCDWSMRWEAKSALPPLDVGEFEFHTQQDADLIRFNIRVRPPGGNVGSWGGALGVEAVQRSHAHELHRERIDDKVAVVIACNHGRLCAFVEQED